MVFGFDWRRGKREERKRRGEAAASGCGSVEPEPGGVAILNSGCEIVKL